MISVDEARQRIVEGLTPVGSETLPLTAAVGRVCAADIVARLTRPEASTSAMDGYAVRASDFTDGLPILAEVDHIPAGQMPKRAIGPGECSRIFTGAILPEGADAILIQEDVKTDGTTITATASVESGKYVRPRGQDFSRGETLIQAGKCLTARDVGLIAAANIPWVSVRRRPRIAILSTGDEIVFPGEPMSQGQIAGAASHSLAALVRSCGAEPVVLGVAPDQPDALTKAAKNAAGCDFLVTIGGASVGDYDLVHDVLGLQGMSIEFQKIAMRPGKPLMFGKSGDVQLLGLPGNPVSSYLCTLLFLRPAIDVLLGCPQDVDKSFFPLAEALPANGVREHYMRAQLIDVDGETKIQAFEDQDSSLLATLSKADGLIVRPVNAPPVAAGDLVPVIPFDRGLANL